MNPVTITFVRRWLGWLALITSGCMVMTCAAYGMPEPKGDAKVSITDFSYTPANTVTRGTSLVFQVTLNRTPRPNYSQGVRVSVDTVALYPNLSGRWFGLAVYDDGLAPDAVAGDRIYTGSWEVPEDYPLGGPVPLNAQYYDKHVTAPGFTVVDGF